MQGVRFEVKTVILWTNNDEEIFYVDEELQECRLLQCIPKLIL